MQKTRHKKIGFIGLGSMGKPMAVNILKADFPLIVYDIREEPMAEMKKLGAKVAKSSKEVGTASDTVVVMVLNYPQVKQAVLPPEGTLAGMKKGSTLIITSTIAPWEVQEVEKVAKEIGVEVIDAPVSGGVARAQEGSLTLMVGAEPEVLKANEDVLKALGKYIYHIGKVGQGQVMKMINQLLVTANIIALGEGLVLAKKLNLNLPLVLDVVSNSAGDSFALRTCAPRMIAGDFQTRGAIDTLTKDTRIIMDTGIQVGAPLLITSVCYHVCRIAESRGFGRQDIAALVKVFEEYAGIRVCDCEG